jgi:hypothetical protein
MCRNIVKLRQSERLPTEEELRNAALQYVRKITGYRTPSKANRPAFERAVDEIVEVTRGLFERLNTGQS